MTEESVFEHWRDRLGLRVGMTKEEALECFREGRATKRTCERCEVEKYSSFCPVHLICEEADTVEVEAGKGKIATSENTPIFLTSMGFKDSSIGFISTSKGGDGANE